MNGASQLLSINTKNSKKENLFSLKVYVTDPFTVLSVVLSLFLCCLKLLNVHNLSIVHFVFDFVIANPSLTIKHLAYLHYACTVHTYAHKNPTRFQSSLDDFDDRDFCCGITVNDFGIFDNNVAAELSMTTLPLLFNVSAHDHILLCVAC